MSEDLTHVDARGQVRMVDVSGKEIVHREAVAEGFFCASSVTLDRIMAGDTPKGEALAAARIAGIQAAKKCGELIPLCHPLPVDAVRVDFSRTARDRVRIEAAVVIAARTGVEMEALTAVAIAALTLYDMTKAIDRNLMIADVRLVSKSKTPINQSD